MTVKKQLPGKTPAASRTAVGRTPKSGEFKVKTGSRKSSTQAIAGFALAQSPRKASNTEIRATTALKPAGGSLVMTVPAAVRRALGYTQGTELSVLVDDGRMIIEAVVPAQPTPVAHRPKYTLDDLLYGANADAPLNEAERAWQDAAPVGRETW